MRTLLITPLFPTEHGFMIGRDRKLLVEKMRELGHEVSVIALGRRPKSDTKGGIYDIPSVTLPLIDYPIADILALSRLIKKIGGDFDVHHYYQQEYPTILPSFLLRSRVKVLTVDNFPGVDWSYGIGLIDAFARLESLTIGRKALRNFDGIIFLSSASKKTAVHLEPSVTSKKLAWIPHGVDTQAIRPDEIGRRKMRDQLGIEGFTAIFVGRLVSVKGITYLAQAIRRLDKKGFEGNFIIVGDGPERGLLESLKLSHSRVLLLGYQKNPSKYIQAADTLVLPSLGEGCPNVVLEAFACGKPVIASRVGAVPDLIQHGKTGMILNLGDVRGLVDSIRSMTNDIEKTRRMGKEAREFAEAQLDWHVVATRIVGFYSATVKK
jgi:glycosyltransferase involved in cell wall biosynthesis